MRRIGIDETSYRKGRKYLTVVVDHERGCLIWAHEGYGKAVINLFLDELTREQRRGIEVVTAYGAKWIKALVKRRCPNARWVMDPFHVVQWMNDALDGVRREEWRAAKKAARDAMPKHDGPGRPRKGEETPPEARELKEAADSIKGSRFALAKNSEGLADAQREKLGGGNGRVEAINNKIKVTVRAGYGFRNADNLVALLMLRCSDCEPALPGRSEKPAKREAA